MPFDDPGYVLRYKSPPDSPYVARLLTARSLIENEKNWLQGCYAQKITFDDGGEEDEREEFDTGLAPGANHFCLVAALQCAWDIEEFDNSLHGDASTPPDRLILGFINGLDDPFDEDAGDWSSIPDWNDNKDREHSEVLAVLDKAITFAREKGL